MSRISPDFTRQLRPPCDPGCVRIEVRELFIRLIVVDVVTDRRADLHAELLRRLNSEATPPASELWAASYRPWRRGEQTNLEIWHEALTFRSPLPTLPFWLKNGPCIKLDLDATYMRTLRDQRMLVAGSAS